MLPGGFLRRGEDARDGALRELREELHLDLFPNVLKLGWRGSTVFEHRDDLTTIWEAILETEPSLTIDGREIATYEWHTVDEARQLELPPAVHAYLASLADAPC